jgi:hypothetical protein
VKKSTDPKCRTCKDELVVWVYEKGKTFARGCTVCLKAEEDQFEEITDPFGFKLII